MAASITNVQLSLSEKLELAKALGVSASDLEEYLGRQRAIEEYNALNNAKPAPTPLAIASSASAAATSPAFDLSFSEKDIEEQLRIELKIESNRKAKAAATTAAITPIASATTSVTVINATVTTFTSSPMSGTAQQKTKSDQLSDIDNSLDTDGASACNSSSNATIDAKQNDETQRLLAIQAALNNNEKQSRLTNEKDATESFFMSEFHAQTLHQLEREEQEANSATLAFSIEHGGALHENEAETLKRYKDARNLWKASLAAKVNKDATEKLLTEAREHPAVQRGGIDAHTYTKTFINQKIPALLALDTAFQLSEIKLANEKKLLGDKFSAASVLTEAQEFLETGLAHLNRFSEDKKLSAEEKNKHEALIARSNELHATKMANIKATFAKISGQKIDGETNIDIHEFVYRNWVLAKKLGVNQMAAIASVFSDNIADKGGCTAGLMARLFSTYVINLVTILAPQLHNAPKAKDSGKMATPNPK